MQSDHLHTPCTCPAAASSDADEGQLLSKRASWADKHGLPQPTAPPRTRQNRFPKIPKCAVGGQQLQHFVAVPACWGDAVWAFERQGSGQGCLVYTIQHPSWAAAMGWKRTLTPPLGRIFATLHSFAFCSV